MPPRSPATTGDERVYYPGLDGLRAVAIAMVYGFHDRTLDLVGQLGGLFVEIPLALLVDPVLDRFGLPSLSFRAEAILTRPLHDNGWIGVQVFFVLSGFLITTLLLRERERFGRVDLKAFWVRRALRIWPLYYLIVAIGFGVIPWVRPGFSPTLRRAMYADHLPAFLAFLGNWSMARGWSPPIDSVTVLWSVCVEEQFYLFVPLIVAFVGPRWRVPIVAAAIAGAVVYRYRLAAAGVGGITLRYDTLVNLDTLLAGVLLALLARRWPLIGRMRWAWRLAAVAGLGVIAATPLGVGGPSRLAIGQVLIWSWAASLVVLAADDGERSTRLLRRPAMVWLGRISYGLYLYHMIAIGLVCWLRSRLPTFEEDRLVMAVLGPLVTVGLAAASYYGYERQFLRLKRRWTRVPSRPIDAGEGPVTKDQPRVTMAVEPGPAPDPDPTRLP